MKQMKNKKERGITLIALVITIIVLIILAGVSINLLFGNFGVVTKAKEAKEKSIEGQLKEEISLTIQSIQTEEIYKGNSVTLETLAGGQLQKKLKDITAELTDGEINGEYKDYEYTIDSNLNVTINGPVTGVRIKGDAEVQSGYVFEGTSVEIKVTASIINGTITGIEAPEEATIKIDTSATEKVYTVNKNGTYIFKITSDSGKTKNVTANVENILSAPQITVSEVTENSFKINVENNYPEGVITEYKYYVGSDVKSQGTIDKRIVVTGLKEETEYNNIKVVAYINPSTSKESKAEKVYTLMVGEIPYSWDEISEIAREISNTSTITSDSEEASVTVGEQVKTLKVGQMKKLDGKKVRILGFNHDDLTDTGAYGGTNTKAGISFEYVDFIKKAQMNSGETNSGGWEKCALRNTLKGTIYNSLSIKDKIKAVNKKYIANYSSATESTCSDKLWLLSCGEIWKSGYNGGNTRGYSKNTEGNQYKYYKLGTQVYNSSSAYTKKPNASSTSKWWLRSPYYNISGFFCIIFERPLL